MAKLTLDEFLAQGPALPAVRDCKHCPETGLIWDTTKDGRPWLFNVVVIGDQDAVGKFAVADPKRFSNLEAKGLIRETSTDGFVIVAKWAGGAHLCPAFGPNAQTQSTDEGEEVFDTEDVVEA